MDHNRETAETTQTVSPVGDPLRVKQQKQDESRCRRVENAIYRRARGYKVAVKKTYKVKRVEYDPDTGKKTLEREELQTGTDEVLVPADVRAGAYYLNNRDPARWREHPHPEEADRSGEREDGFDGVGGIVELPETAGLSEADGMPETEGITV